MNAIEAVVKKFRFGVTVRTVRLSERRGEANVFRFPQLTAFASAEIANFQQDIEEVGGEGAFFVLEAVPEGIELRVYCPY